MRTPALKLLAGNYGTITFSKISVGVVGTFNNTSSCTGFILFCQTFPIQIEIELNLPLFRLMFKSYTHVSMTYD